MNPSTANMPTRRFPSTRTWFMRTCTSKIAAAWRKWVVAGVMLVSPLLFCGQADPAPVPNQATNPKDAKLWWRGITTDGYLSFSYTNNSNDPIPRLNQFRVFDFNDDDPQLDVSQLVIQRAISEPKEFGFRFD